MASIVVIASNKPDKCVRSLRWWSGFDRVVLYIHENDLLRFEAAFQERCLPLPEIWLHSIPTRADGQSAMGSIRYYSMEKTRSVMGLRDWAVLADDDLKHPRPVSKNKMPSGGYRYPCGTSRDLFKGIKKVADEARDRFSYFTCSFSAMRNNGYKPERPLRAVWAWSGLFGFFKSSENPFSPVVGIGADIMAAAQKLVSRKTLPTLCNDALVAEWEIVSANYKTGLAREENYRKFASKTGGVFKLSSSNRSGVVRLHLDRTHLFIAKRATPPEYR